MSHLLSSLVILGSITPTVEPLYAQSTTTQPLPPNRTQQTMTPYQLVFMAYQGFWKAWDIPQAAALVESHQSGKLSAQDLVQKLVQLEQVPVSVLEDAGYINAVDATLRSLQRRS